MQQPFVFFDLGNVLVNFDHQIAVQKLAALSGRSPDEVRQAVFDSDLQNRFVPYFIAFLVLLFFLLGWRARQKASD